MRVENSSYQSMITNQAGQRKTVNFADIFSAVSKSQQAASSDSVYISNGCNKTLTTEQKNMLREKYDMDDMLNNPSRNKEKELLKDLKELGLLSEREFELASTPFLLKRKLMDSEEAGKYYKEHGTLEGYTFAGQHGGLRCVEKNSSDYVDIYTEIHNLIDLYKSRAAQTLAFASEDPKLYADGEDSEFFKSRAEALYKVADVLEQVFGGQSNSLKFFAVRS